MSTPLTSINSSITTSVSFSTSDMQDLERMSDDRTSDGFNPITQSNPTNLDIASFFTKNRDRLIALPGSVSFSKGSTKQASNTFPAPQSFTTAHAYAPTEATTIASMSTSSSKDSSSISTTRTDPKVISVEGSQVPANLLKLWEQPKVFNRRLVSDADVQQTRTSSRMAPAMLPASHCRTPENARYDFYEDSMSDEVISDLDLQMKDWTKPIPDLAMKTTINKVLNAQMEATAPTLCNNDVVESLAETLQAWSREDFRSPLVHSCKARAVSAISHEDKMIQYWYTYRYLTSRHLQETICENVKDQQTLFPASIVRYLHKSRTKSDGNQSYPYDAEKMKRDYAILRAGPWGR